SSPPRSSSDLNGNAGGFKRGTASTTTPTLTAAGHATVAGTTCMTCHESALYIGMQASSATTAGDSRPTALDKLHPINGDCATCHTTIPTFLSDVTAGGKPANHIPTSAACAQCHTTPGNSAGHPVSSTHQGAPGR